MAKTEKIHFILEQVRQTLLLTSLLPSAADVHMMDDPQRMPGSLT